MTPPSCGATQPSLRPPLADRRAIRLLRSRCCRTPWRSRRCRPQFRRRRSGRQRRRSKSLRSRGLRWWRRWPRQLRRSPGTTPAMRGTWVSALRCRSLAGRSRRCGGGAHPSWTTTTTTTSRQRHAMFTAHRRTSHLLLLASRSAPLCQRRVWEATPLLSSSALRTSLSRRRATSAAVSGLLPTPIPTTRMMGRPLRIARPSRPAACREPRSVSASRILSSTLRNPKTRRMRCRCSLVGPTRRCSDCFALGPHTAKVGVRVAAGERCTPLRFARTGAYL
mmetsp:Transcript_80271/g.233092  ORF Transcript_80271/g.233092 Transcript_80271/m.233092 type:complete len:279 (+) Transcript_80271:465-1301(+)